MICLVGNSHVNCFRDYPGFKTFHMWSATAYNFVQNGYFQSGMKMIEENLKSEFDSGSFVVGEIDCRWHIPKQADIQGRRDSEMVEECVDRFFPCYLELQKKHNAIVFGAHPTTNEGHTEKPGCLIYGDALRRNSICAMWDLLVEEKARKANLPFISIYNHLINKDGSTKMEYYLDYCHLDGIKVRDFWAIEAAKAGIII